MRQMDHRCDGGIHGKEGSMRRNGKGLIDFLPDLLAAADFSLVVDNAKSHSDLYKNLYRRQRLSLLSSDLEKLNSSGRFNAICECFQEIHPKPTPRHPRFDRWGPSDKPKKRATRSLIDDDDDDDDSNNKAPMRPLVALPDPTADRPPLLMNASMPQRQESEDPQVLRAILRSVNETGILNESDTSSEEEGDNGKFPYGEFSLPSASLPPMPQRQQSLVHTAPAMPRRQQSLVVNAPAMPQRQQSLVSNAPMPQRQQSLVDDASEDVAVLQRPPMENYASMPRDEQLENIPVAPPPSLINNASMPRRQQSEDPEMVKALLMSLKDLGK